MAGRVRRGLVGLVLLGGSVVTTNTEASAAEQGAEGVQWRGHAAEVVLTDCSPTMAAGATCTAWAVFAFRERLNFHGERHAHRGVSVLVLDVTITEDPLAPDVGYRSEGFADDADVAVRPDLSSARAAATIDLARCVVSGDDVICTPTGESVQLDISWTAAGPAERFRDRFREMLDPGVLFNSAVWGRVRPAAVTAEVDGEPAAVVPVALAGLPLLHADASAEVCVHCALPEP